MGIEELQPFAALAAGVLLGTAAPWPLKAAWTWLAGRRAAAKRELQAERGAAVAEAERLAARVTELEDLVDLLRKALDKHLIRESAIAAIAELLIFAIDHVPDPGDAIASLRRRALAILVDARAHISAINSEPRA